MGRVVHPHIITPDSALGGMDIRRSVRCGNGGSFSRTPSVTGNQKVWTWSAWVKKWGQGGTNHLFSSEGSNDGIAAIYFNSDKIHTYFDTSGSNPYGEVTARYYRDPTSWMHIVWQVDALNQTQTIWVNGEDQSVSSSRNPPNYAYSMNQSGKLNAFGVSAYGGSHTNGIYFAEMHHSDGYKYDPSYYGYTEPQTGIWRPKKVTGISYGTNGFYLDFSDNSTAAALGKDRSGNGNDWTPNGSISVANDKTNDSLLDTPTNNFCTLNPVRRQTDNCHFDQGNLQASGSSTSYPGAVGTIALSSGKWYYEFQIDTYNTSGNDPMVGICRNSYVSGGAGRIVYRAGGHYITSTPSEPSDPAAFTVGDIIGVAIDLDDAAGKIRFYKNGSLQPILANGDLDDVKSDLSISSLGGVYPYVQMYTNDVCTINFGQRPFSYTPPSGHKKLTVNTNNNSLDYSTPSILKPKRHFDVAIWTGNNTAGRLIPLEFKPDFVWVKCRTAGHDHQVTDSVRGSSKALAANLNEAEIDWDVLYSGNNKGMGDYVNGGFILDDDGNNARYNNTGQTYVAWCWKGGGAAVSNTNGNITSSVSVNEKAGFSIVSYTGNGSNGQTIGHGLTQAPQWIMLKNRDAVQNWRVWHHKLAADGSKRLILDQTNQSDDAGFLNDTAPTSTVFTLGNADDAWNVNGNKFIAYCWYEVPGYSKFGSYTGNGSDDGTYVHLGFKPAWLLIKRTDSAENWVLKDSARNTFNSVFSNLNTNTENVEFGSFDDVNSFDFYSNGFKIKGSNSAVNANNGTFVYMAFAEQPEATSFDTFPNAR